MKQGGNMHSTIGMWICDLNKYSSQFRMVPNMWTMPQQKALGMKVSYYTQKPRQTIFVSN